MPARPTVTVAAALACVLALGVAGCADEKQLTDDASPPGPVTAVRMDNQAGGVTVQGRPGTTGASVHREIQYRGDRPPPAQTAHVEGGTLVLDGCGQDCSVTYTVTVPPGLPVTGTTSDGDVTLTDVGAVDVGTTNGELSLEGVAGDARARTRNGGIRGHDLRGTRTEADTTNGGIDLAPATPQDIRVVTTNGEVTVVLPGGGYRVDARSVNGRPDIAVPSDPAAPHTVDVQTTNGSITVRPG